MGINEYLDRVFKNKQEEGEIIYGVRCVLKYHSYMPKKFNILNLWPVLLFGTFTMGCFFHLMNYLDTNDRIIFVEIGDDITLTLSTLVMIFFHSYYFYKRHDIQTLYKEMGSFERFEPPDNITKINRFANLFAVSYLIFLYVMFFVSSFALLREECVNDVNDACGLIFPGYFPFLNIHRSPYREIYAIIQTSAITSSGVTSIALSLIVIIPAEIIVGYLRKLKEFLIQVKKLKKGKLRKQQIKMCVQYHYRIIGFSEEYNNITRNVYLVFITFGAYFIALCTYTLIFRFGFAALLHLLCYFCNTLFICFFGERLIQESTSVAYTAYEAISWEDVETQKDLLLLMKRAQLELYIDAGGLGSMRNELFMSIMKTTYSTITLLLNLQ